MSVQTTRRYCEWCRADVEMPVDTLEGLASAPQAIADALRAATGRPSEGWSPAEVVAHLADTEVVTGWRIRQVLSQEEPTIESYDQDAWAAALRYPSRDPEAALRSYSAQRAVNVEIMRLMPEEAWERPFQHEEYGRCTLRTLLRHKSDHDLAHLRQIQGAT